MVRYALPAIVTCLALILYLALSFNVGRARGKFRVEAPATTGDPGFERAYRVQMNTLEQLVVFLPALWLAAFFVSPLWAALLGLVWVAARGFYAWSYLRDPATRGPGFIVGLVASSVLLAVALAGAAMALGRTGIFGG